MQISVEISSQMQQEAAMRGLPIHAFVELLVERGFESLLDRSSITSAVERIRALRKPVIAGGAG